MDSRTFALKGNVLYSGELRELVSRPDSVLVCEEGRVSGVFPQLPGRYQGISVEDHGNCLVIPGLVDLHLHAPQYPFRGLGMDLELLDWLETHTFPEEAKYRDITYAEQAYQLFVRDLRQSASTRACVFATVHVPAAVRLMELLEQSGLRTMVGKVNMDRNCPDSLRERGAAESLRDTRDWLEQSAGFERTRPILTPRFVPSCSDELLAGLGELQRKTGLPVQSHLSENPSEVEWVRTLCPGAESYGDAYHMHGLFGGQGRPAIMAHCVHCTDAEVELMAQGGVYMAHCPQSNTNLSSGIAPVRRFLQAGVPVGLGTDIAGGFSLSMLRAMADAVQVSKLRWRLVENACAPLSMAEAFYLATRGGGSFFGKVGAFEEGFEFDALVLDDGGIESPLELTPAQRLERLAYLPEEIEIRRKIVGGHRVI